MAFVVDYVITSKLLGRESRGNHVVVASVSWPVALSRIGVVASTPRCCCYQLLSTTHFTPFEETLKPPWPVPQLSRILLVFTRFIGPNFCSDLPESHRDPFLSVEPLESLALRGTHVQINPLRSPFSSATFNGEPSRMSHPRRLVSFRRRRHWSQTLSPPRFNVLTDTVSRIVHAG